MLLAGVHGAHAQVEQLLDEVDLNVRVTRAEFESISADLFDRVPGPLLKVAELAGIPLVI